MWGLGSTLVFIPDHYITEGRLFTFRHVVFFPQGSQCKSDSQEEGPSVLGHLRVSHCVAHTWHRAWVALLTGVRQTGQLRLSIRQAGLHSASTIAHLSDHEQATPLPEASVCKGSRGDAIAVREMGCGTCLKSLP